jgi:ElaA protein
MTDHETDHEKDFAALTVDELYAILALRQRVFVVEQACAYLDCDDHDQRAIHLWSAGNALAAYARVLPPGEKFAEASIGRVVSAPEARGTGAGRAIVQRSIAVVKRRFGDVPIRISAQSYLSRFYTELGFERVSDEYLLDNIPHIDMVRPA